MSRILIAGIGNIFLGDDAFGVEVAAALSGRPLPRGIEVVDFGIRGLDLAYALLAGYRAVILVDAVRRGGEAGDLFVIEPDAESADAVAAGNDPLIDTHEMHPEKVLRLVRTLGGSLERIVLVGCEPAPLDDYSEMAPGLSPAVQAAVAPAAELALRLAGELLSVDTGDTKSSDIELPSESTRSRSSTIH